jgi:hypothetical protein
MTKLSSQCHLELAGTCWCSVRSSSSSLKNLRHLHRWRNRFGCGHSANCSLCTAALCDVVSLHRPRSPNLCDAWLSSLTLSVQTFRAERRSPLYKSGTSSLKLDSANVTADLHAIIEPSILVTFPVHRHLQDIAVLAIPGWLKIK